MKIISTICFLLFGLFTFGQSVVIESTEYEYLELEEQYVENNEDPRAEALIELCNEAEEKLRAAFSAKGENYDRNVRFNNRMLLKKHPEIKEAYKVYMKALKDKLLYFVEKEGFEEPILRTYSVLSLHETKSKD